MTHRAITLSVLFQLTVLVYQSHNQQTLAFSPQTSKQTTRTTNRPFDILPILITQSHPPNHRFSPSHSTTTTLNSFPSPNNPSSSSSSSSSSSPAKSLKPAAQPLLLSGKALAVSGEALIDLTDRLNLWGGGLSAVGAYIRNAGDYIAESGASCRFKTGTELVCDELREGATCLSEAVVKGRDGEKDAEVDGDDGLRERIAELLPDLALASLHLENAGAGIMKRVPLRTIGDSLYEAGTSLESASRTIAKIAPDEEDGTKSAAKMAYAAEQMKEAGEGLRGGGGTKKGGNWLKGGM